MARGLIPFDRRALNGAVALTGLDEAGRGALAGPVVASAVRCEESFYRRSWCRRHSRGVDDSKRLTPEERAAIIELFMEARHEKWIQVGIGSASVGEIERHNIFGATVLAMRRAFEEIGGAGTGMELWSSGELESSAHAVLIDGRPIRRFPCPHRGIVKGDQRSLAIALAGIHAKEWRDARMRELDELHPEYGFARHKGYGTQLHFACLRRHGASPHHRALFLRKLMERPGRTTEVIEDSLF